MANPEINQAWEAKLAADADARADAQAAERWHAEILERQGAMQTLAQQVINATGRNSGRESGLPDVYEWQVSRDIPLGKLDRADAAGRDFGYAWVSVARDMYREEVTKQGRFFRYTESVERVSDKVNQVTIVLSAGKEGDTASVPFEYVHWSITQGDNDEGLSQVEQRLAYLSRQMGLSASEN